MKYVLIINVGGYLPILCVFIRRVVCQLVTHLSVVVGGIGTPEQGARTHTLVFIEKKTTLDTAAAATKEKTTGARQYFRTVVVGGHGRTVRFPISFSRCDNIMIDIDIERIHRYLLWYLCTRIKNTAGRRRQHGVDAIDNIHGWWFK